MAGARRRPVESQVSTRGVALATVQQGCLALADITGYTQYLAGVELEHSQDVLADLMSTVVNQMRGLLHLAKLEGDAVFCYEHAGEADGSTLLAMIESCYFAFAKRLQLIDRHTTCECNACRLIPRLNLKFAVHQGQFVIHEVAGSRELVGRDVIVAHRLLKNSVSKQMGLRGYALLTEACVQRFGFDPAVLSMTAHTEAYEDVGEIAGYVLNLEERWQEEQRRRAVYIAPGQGYAISEFDLTGPPPIVWDYLTSPAKRVLWQPDTLRVEETHAQGVRGVGTVNHCVHGGFTVEEEYLDWKPFQYYSDHSTTPMGSARFTTELTPLGPDRTRVTIRMQPDVPPDASPDMMQMFEQTMLPMLRHTMHVSAESLAKLLAGVKAEAQERSESLAE